MIDKPKMILFDYGQTLINEEHFDGIRGTAAVLQYAKVNKYNKTAEQIQEEANALNKELGRFDPVRQHLFQAEVPNTPFEAYLYESQGIELSITYEEASRIFWDAAAPGKASPGMQEFLGFLKEKKIRTGVISNISYGGGDLAKRINSLLPDNEFEFIIASSEYVFRKPNRRIFELALEKAELKPREVWYVGDQYECDIVGAGNAGLLPVWYTGCIEGWQKNQQEAANENERVQKMLIVESWDALREIIDGKN